MRFWQRKRHVLITATAAILWTPAFVPAAATAVITFIVAEYQVEAIRKVRAELFELGETALSKAFVGAVDHMARVHADHRKMEVAAKKPTPEKATIAPVCVAPAVVKPLSPPQQDAKPPVTKPTVKKPARWSKPRRKSPPPDCACSADREDEWTNSPSYRPGFYETAPDYREPFYGEEN